MMSKLTHVLAAFVLAACVSAAQAGPYSVTVMDLAGGTDSQGWDINNLGVFVGSATVNGEAVGYLVSGGSTTTLSGPAGAISTSALGISDGGIVVGSFSSTKVDDGTGTGTLVDGPQSGFILVGSSYTTLNLPGATDTQLRGISPDGRYVTGFATMADGSSTSFVYDRSTSTFSTIVNSPALTVAQGVTNAGLVVGNYRVIPAGGPFPAGRFSFTYDGGTGTRNDLSIPGADIRSRGITESDLVDGFFSDSAGNLHGFVGSASSYEVFNAPDGANTTALEGINNAGWLAGQYTDASGLHAFLARPVGEPGTWALILAAFGGLFITQRRRN
jgi:hypothetical protein